MPTEMDARLQKALDFAMYAHKPDGLIPALSDGDSRSFLNLLEQGYALYGNEEWLYVATQGVRGKPPAQPSKAFPKSGYYILRSGWGEHEPFAEERYLIFDCGPLGAGNHGHFDLLSFELAAYGRSLIVDPGRYTYHESGTPNWRALFRGTAAHNTVLVDGKHQTRYGPAPGKARYKVQGPAPDYELKAFTPTFIHGIARSREYAVVHERRIYFLHKAYWVIIDELHAQQSHDYELLFHLSEHAQDRVEVRSAHGMLEVLTPNLLIVQPQTPAVALHIDAGSVAYRYGHKQPAPVLRFAQRAADAVFFTVLYPFKTT
jgi:hypothetical protein